MEKKLFCVSCGNACDNDAYCSLCGISVQADSAGGSYMPHHHSHCITCGNKLGEGDSYCSVCGQECFEYAVSEESAMGVDSFAGLKDTIGSAIKNKSAGEVLKSIPLSNYVSAEKIKSPDFWVPSVIFAVASVAVGLILAAVLNLLVKNAIQGLLEGLLYQAGLGQFGIGLDDVNLSLGAVTVWLLTCLSGLTFNFRGSVDVGGWFSSEMASASFRGQAFAGLIILAVVPLVALLVGNLAKNAYIKTKADAYNGDSKVSSAVLGSLLFAFINIILMLFPSPIARALSSSADILGAEISFRASIGYIFVNVLFFSFILALIVSMPKWKDLLRTAAESGKAWVNSLSVSVQLIKKLLVAAIIITVVSSVLMVVLFLISFGDELGAVLGVASDVEVPVGAVISSVMMILVILVNLVFWTMSMLTGGNFDYRITFREGRESQTASFNDMFGLADNPFQDFTYFLLVIAGFLLAVYIFYKYLERDNKYLIRGLFAVGFSTLVLSVLYAMTNISFRMNAVMGGEGGSVNGYIGTYTAGNIFKAFIVMALAFGLVYASSKVPVLKNILDKYTGLSIKLIYLFTAVVTIIITLRTSYIFGSG